MAANAAYLLETFESEERQRNKSRRALQSSYSLRAKSGFKYWQGTNNKDYCPKDPVKSRFSFGERFNSGRFGCTNDRYYTNGAQNLHYWSSVENKETRLFEENLASISTETCVDEDLFNECYSLCRIDFLQCRESCENALCENECVNKFGECSSYCPCGTNCPNGCLNCASPVCSDACDSAATENHHFIECREESLENQAICIRACPPDRDCFEQCNDRLLQDLDSCPCVENIITTTTSSPTTTKTSTYVPTTSSTIMQHILVMTDSLKESFTISIDGLTKTFPSINATRDSYLSQCPYALFKDELFVFGGGWDYQREFGFFKTTTGQESVNFKSLTHMDLQ
ncbi:Oidioi.mRNA.OKI2018_I69.PAR.g9691.t1.cds [Oikopleura dioica]|uniref:Oidioi.mRNA.OKI2018_I69.PAR.g9691.t1.cds n=1 Tax=Oikopleura dioica TaxID=34765 RepID=A0ABN7RLT1_OIKDI|nr:Oidioi.mRNA.OKI2018_I69.PAR.g9691.t1.cds [Oikopleura dioica]